jgi:nucleoside-diphosphate-sugar epimerase
MVMRIAITGSRGFIGSHLVPQLKRQDFELIEISRETGYDLNQWESVKDILKCDVLIHLAAKTFVPDSFNNPRDFYQTNLNLTINALELARKWKARVIYMSSYFYGTPQYIPVDEKHPIAPHNPYAQTKYMSEELCRAYNRDFDLPIIAFRLFNIYGPGQNGNFLIPEIMGKIKNGGTITLKDPRPKRDYIHVDDVVSAVLAGINYTENGFHIYNLGTGNSISVEDLVNLIKIKSPIPFEVEFTNEFRRGEVLDSVADVGKLKSELNWELKVTSEAGIKSIFEFKL